MKFGEKIKVPINYSDIVNEQVLDIIVIPRSSSEGNKKILNWTITEMKPEEMFIQLNFQDP